MVTLAEAAQLNEHTVDQQSLLSLTVSLDYVLRLPSGKRLLLFNANSVNYEQNFSSATKPDNFCKVKNFLF